MIEKVNYPVSSCVKGRFLDLKDVFYQTFCEEYELKYTRHSRGALKVIGMPFYIDKARLTMRFLSERDGKSGFAYLLQQHAESSNDPLTLDSLNQKLEECKRMHALTR
jgi:hypothetical protein